MAEIGCDVLLCSPLQVLRAASRDRLRPRSERAEAGARTRRGPPPANPLGRRFETGTLPYELLAGFSATIDYLDSLGGMSTLRDYERMLGERLLDGLPENVELYGVPDHGRPRSHVPAERRGRRGRDGRAGASRERGIGVWYADNWYCVALADRLPPQSLRVGLAHYNNAAEVDRLLDELARIARIAGPR